MCIRDRLRRRDGKGGFKQGFGAHADQAVGQVGKEGRVARKNLKKEDLSGGLTRQEARWRKTMGKAISAAQGSGTNVWYEGDDGKITSIADTSGPTNQQSLNRGKGRRKAQRMVKRANRIEKRMKRRGGWQKAEYDRNQ